MRFQRTIHLIIYLLYGHYIVSLDAASVTRVIQRNITSYRQRAPLPGYDSSPRTMSSFKRHVFRLDIGTGRSLSALGRLHGPTIGHGLPLCIVFWVTLSSYMLEVGALWDI